MDQNRISTEEFWNPEHIVEKFWNGLAEGKVLARKCPECGAIEFPPHIACNSCGYHETEWMELKGTGMLKSFVFNGAMNVRLEVQFDEGPSINAIVLGVNKKKGRELADKLPAKVKPVFYDMGRYTTLFFELDEEA